MKEVKKFIKGILLRVLELTAALFLGIFLTLRTTDLPFSGFPNIIHLCVPAKGFPFAWQGQAGMLTCAPTVDLLAFVLNVIFWSGLSYVMFAAPYLAGKKWWKMVAKKTAPRGRFIGKLEIRFMLRFFNLLKNPKLWPALLLGLVLLVIVSVLLYWGVYSFFSFVPNPQDKLPVF